MSSSPPASDKGRKRTMEILQDFTSTTAAYAEQKRDREKKRRIEFNSALDELSELVFQIDPLVVSGRDNDSGYGKQDSSSSKKSGKATTITNRTDLIHCAAALLRNMSTEIRKNEAIIASLKVVIGDDSSNVSQGGSMMTHSTSTRGHTAPQIGPAFTSQSLSQNADQFGCLQFHVPADATGGNSGKNKSDTTVLKGTKERHKTSPNEDQPRHQQASTTYGAAASVHNHILPAQQNALAAYHQLLTAQALHQYDPAALLLGHQSSIPAPEGGLASCVGNVMAPSVHPDQVAWRLRIGLPASTSPTISVPVSASRTNEKMTTGGQFIQDSTHPPEPEQSFSGQLQSPMWQQLGNRNHEG